MLISKLLILKPKSAQIVIKSLNHYHTNLSGGRIDHFSFREIRLIANQQFVHIIGSVPLDFLQPCTHIFEGLFFGTIVHDDYTVGSTVIAGSNRSESFLACCIPLYISQKKTLEIGDVCGGRGGSVILTICNLTVFLESPSSKSSVRIF